MGQNSRNRGIIIITAVFLVLLISALGIGYLALVNNQLEMADISLKSAKTFYLAESGISEAILILKDMPEGIPDWTALARELAKGELEEGTYVVEVDLENPPTIDTITIKSTGNLSNFQRIIEVTLKRMVDEGKIVQEGWKEI